MLEQAIKDELRFPVPVPVVKICVYANLKGLANTYQQMDIVTKSTLDDFVRGFNMGNATCDFVDAGDGKECADEKVKGRSHDVF
jgi:hypothetical protein